MAGIHDDQTFSGREPERSEVGAPLEEATQALKDKYDSAKEAIVQESPEPGTTNAKDSSSAGSTGLDDAKAMLRDEYEDAKKGIERHDGRAPEPADASETALQQVKGGVEQGKTKAAELVQSAEEKIEKPDASAPEESMGSIESAKDQIGAKVDAAKNQINTDDLQQSDETRATSDTKGPLGSIAEAVKQAWGSSPKA